MKQCDKFNHRLGYILKDKITGFQGICVGVSRYLTGCDQYLIQPPMKEGKMEDGRWFDDNRLEEVTKGIDPEEVTGEDDGCDMPAPIK